LSTTGFSAGAAFGRAGALGFLAGDVATTRAGSGAISLARGNGQLTLGCSGASTLYGATGGAWGGIGLVKKPFINRNIMFSYEIFSMVTMN
jgi:hypothetical protein